MRVLSGLYQGKTCGTPLCLLIENRDQRSEDYQELENIPRPGHGDYPNWVKTRGNNDLRGGGHGSGRLTAPLCAAGGVLLQILQRKGLAFGARLLSLGPIADSPLDLMHPETFLPRENPWGMPVHSRETAEEMAKALGEAAEAGDSLGGVAEAWVCGLPVGLGAPFFDSLESAVSHVVFSIPGVKGVEFGDGFASARARGSVNNDPFVLENGQVRLAGNRHGGILGGLSSGAPLVLRVAFKPTASIAQPQDSVDLRRGEPVRLKIRGRHDPCFALRAVPCLEAALAIALADHML